MKKTSKKNPAPVSSPVVVSSNPVVPTPVLYLLPLFTPVKAATLALKAAKENEHRTKYVERETSRLNAEKAKAAKVTPIKAAPVVKTKKYTRANAFASAIKASNGGGFKSDIVTLSDSIYAANGGTGNEKEAAWYYNTVVPGLIALGFASYDSEGRLTVSSFANAIAA